MITKRNQFIPSVVFHPGETLKEKLEETKMGVKEFAVRTTKPDKTIIAIIKGDSSITPDMAVAFESVTKIPAHFWLNQQRSYDEFKAREKREQLIESSIEWAKMFPINDMVKNGWIPPCKSNKERVEALFLFFGVNSPKAWEDYYYSQQLKVSFRISLKNTKEPHAISAWLRAGEIANSNNNLETKYSEKKLRNSIAELKKIMIEQPNDFFLKIKEICSRAGVSVIYTKKIPKAPISGVARWINNTPVIQLTNRNKRNDIFWFSFFHEIGHILLHGKKDIFLENIEYCDMQKDKELEADNFAKSLLSKIL